MRAEKGTVYEGGIREPFIVRWPGTVAPNQVSDALISSVDFYPTFLALAKGELTENQILDGKNIMPEILDANSTPERSLFWHYPVYHHDVPKSVIRKGDWKLVENLVDGSYELYNLKNDISERNNLVEDYPEIVKELHNELKNWQEATGAELPVPNPEFDIEKRHLWGKHPDFENLFR